ncbi:MAG: hypothetical protein HZB73_05790 [Nitrosarchaeum sp.]|nr:hypothetical protein [Nitrosarchaeum sp.]
MNNYQKKIHFKKTRRGLSSIVTGAILLSAVTVMGLLVVVWANTNLTTHQKSLDSTVSSNFNKINEKLFIEHIWFGSGPSMNITMNNIGTIGLNVTKIQITNMTSNKTYEFKHTNGGINPGKTLSLKENFGWKTKIPYEVVVFTNRDSQFKTQVNAP